MNRSVRKVFIAVALAAACVVGLCAHGWSDAAYEKTRLRRTAQGRVLVLKDDNGAYYALTEDGRRRSIPANQKKLRMKRRTFDPAAETADGQGASDTGANTRNTRIRAYIVQFHTQALEIFQDEIRRQGARVFCPIPDNALIVHMSDAVRARVASLDFVRWVGPYADLDKLDPAIAEDAAARRGTKQSYSILLLDQSMSRKVKRRILRWGGNVAYEARTRRFEARLNPGQLRRVAALKEVLYIDRATGTGDDGILVFNGGGAAYHPDIMEEYTGRGVTGEILDHGFRISHQEFDRIAFVIHGQDHNPYDMQHGTQVASILYADGRHPLCKGLLPDAELSIIASRFRQGWLGDRPSFAQRLAHTRALVDPDDVYRAVFQNNSWGNLPTTNYTTVSAELDEILFETDLLVTQSQGNEGDRHARPQAWAKNVVAVGGIRGMGTNDLADDKWSGAASIGPAADGRIKPDLAHFSSHVFTASPEQDARYLVFEGTSASTAITSGNFGLLFQMWADGVFHGGPGQNRDVFDSRPHMTTARALMINTARQYDFSGSDADLARTHQGWGFADAKALYQAAKQSGWQLPILVDEGHVIEPLGTHAYTLYSDGAQPLKVTLVYADPPGSPGALIHRVNDLTLKVTSPGGMTYWGNHGLDMGNWSVPGGGPNTVDTVENVFVREPEAGIWTVAVLADEIVVDSHVETPAIDADYALVATGGRESDTNPGDPPGPDPGQDPTGVTFHLIVAPLSGGQVMLEPVLEAYPSGSMVKLTARPFRGWAFRRWSGDVAGTKKNTSVIIDGEKQVRAVFVKVDDDDDEDDDDDDEEDDDDDDDDD